jgi:ABC-2 type transport system permease protein
MDLLGVFFTAATYYYVAKMFGAAAAPFLRAYGGDYFAFVLIGVAFAAYQNVGLNSFSQSLRQEQFLNTLEPLLVTPVSTPRFLIGSSLWDFLYATVRVALYLGVGAAFFGFRLSQTRLAPALAVLVLTLLAFMGLGVFAASFIMRFKRGNPVTWIMEATSNLLGGVLFPLAALPPGLKRAAFFIPMTHALEGLRQTLLMGRGVERHRPSIGLALGFHRRHLAPGRLHLRPGGPPRPRRRDPGTLLMFADPRRPGGQPVRILVGPTGVGKSAVALALARALGAEIISADSRQVYRGLSAGDREAGGRMAGHGRGAALRGGRGGRTIWWTWPASGYKPGATINIKRPPRYTYRAGRVAAPQDTVESTVPLTLSQGGCDLSFTAV